MPARDRFLPQATLTGKRTRPKLLMVGAFLLAVLAAVMPGSDRAALAQTTATVALSHKRRQRENPAEWSLRYL